MNYGRYEIIRELGRGSMGVVYQAHDPKIDRSVAIKVLRQDRVTSETFVKRFLREAKAVGRLSHPNIVTIFDVAEDQGSIYISMEFVEGEPLDKVIRAKGFGLKEIVNLGIQIAETLDYAHQKGVIHRDIKTSNIIVKSDGQIKITDFGIAYIEDPCSTFQTQNGIILGTPAYMSPEQVLGKHVDGRSDIFSLGIILYELSLGKRPFGKEGQNLATLFNEIVHKDPPIPSHANPHIPDNLSQIIMRCLNKEPDERFQTGKDLAESLKSYIKESKSPASTVESEPFSGKKSRRFASFLLITIVLISIIVGLSYYLIKNKGLFKNDKSPVALDETIRTVQETESERIEQDEESEQQQEEKINIPKPPVEIVKPPMSNTESELRSVFDTVKEADAFLANGDVLNALDSLKKADNIFQKIKQDDNFNAIYPQLKKEYKFSQDNIKDQIAQIRKSVSLEKAGGDNQKLVLGKDALSPLVLKAFLNHEGKSIPLREIPIHFKDNKGNTLNSVPTDSKGMASYKPKINQPGTYRFDALLSLGTSTGENIQRSKIFTFNVKAPESALSLAVNFLYEKDGRVSKMYDGLELRSEIDSYQIYFRPMEDCYVYIFQADSHGAITPLFPNYQFSLLDNPVKKGKSYYVPMTTLEDPKWFYLDRNIGKEKIYLLASKTADNELERLFNQITLNADSAHGRRRISKQIEDIFYSHNPGKIDGHVKLQHQRRDKQIFELDGDLIKSAGQDFYYSIGFNHID
jgi:serine/threonine-protein kinase